MAKKYIVKNTTILHNKQSYGEGSIIELEDKEAQKLEDFISPAPNQSTSKPKTETKTQAQKTTKTKSETKTKTEEPATDDGNKTETSENKTDGEKDGGVDNDK